MKIDLRAGDRINRDKEIGDGMKKVQKLWGWRFDVLPSQEIIDFLSGRDVRGLPSCDERLIPYDLWGSRAHALMLCRRRILSIEDGKKILED